MQQINIRSFEKRYLDNSLGQYAGQDLKKDAIDLYIVGDRFIDFANNETVLTVSQCLRLLQAESTKNIKDCTYYILHAGQGLTDDNDNEIITFIKKNNLSHRFKCLNSLFTMKRAKRFMTHKHQDRNTVISEPTKVSEREYEAYLMIDENCAEVSDHLTGQHIQGAVLMEAARQMTLAVTEKYFIEDENRQQVSFISNTVETKFHSYAFPLEIKIHYKILKHRGLIKHNSRFTVLVSFIQDELVVSEVTYDFSVLSKSYIHQKESEAAKSIIWRAISKGAWNGQLAATT